jgi:hypothetical protein
MRAQNQICVNLRPSAVKCFRSFLRSLRSFAAIQIFSLREIFRFFRARDLSLPGRRVFLNVIPAVD